MSEAIADLNRRIDALATTNRESHKRIERGSENAHRRIDKLMDSVADLEQRTARSAQRLIILHEAALAVIRRVDALTIERPPTGDAGDASVATGGD